MDSLYYLGLIFVLGSLAGWISKKMKIPSVVGYISLGLIIGPETLDIIPKEFADNSKLIIDLSLSIIAVLVGATLKMRTLKGHKKEVVTITLFQSIFTFLIVSIGFIFISNYFDIGISENVVLIALFLGAIASATAPAAPMAVVHELKAHGHFTTTFLAIVVVDDAIALIMFSLALAVGSTLIIHEHFELIQIVDAISLIFFSSLIGIVAALIGSLLDKLFNNNSGVETISTIGLVFIVYSVSEYFKLEPLLSAMAMGIVMTNISADFDLVEEEIDNHIIELIFMLFFVMSAMHLMFDTLYIIPYAIVAYIVFRVLGKVIGSYLGGVISHSTANIKKYMGLALLPQAGIAIGLALSLQKDPNFVDIAPIILNIVIATTLIHELIGPVITRYVIKKVGESYE